MLQAADGRRPPSRHVNSAAHGMPPWAPPLQEERKELLAGGEAGLRQRRAQLEGDTVAAAEEVTGGLRRTRQVRGGHAGSRWVGACGVSEAAAPVGLPTALRTMRAC